MTQVRGRHDVRHIQPTSTKQETFDSEIPPNNTSLTVQTAMLIAHTLLITVHSC